MSESSWSSDDEWTKIAHLEINIAHGWWRNSRINTISSDPECSNIGGICQDDRLPCSGPYLSGKCSGGSNRRCCSPGSAKNYACGILDLYRRGKVHLWNQHASRQTDNAYARTNVEDTCAGRAASLSQYSCRECRTPGAPGGTVNIADVVMKYIYNLAISGNRPHVNEITGACHSCRSKHYSGLAVDLHWYPDNKYGTSYRMECISLGGQYIDESNKNHHHCEF